MLSPFNTNYGWAIASHIALSTLMSLFPFLIDHRDRRIHWF
jgi:uncharacterized BrkB/YihY/UPF0761 family membrane protein